MPKDTVKFDRVPGLGVTPVPDPSVDLDPAAEFRRLETEIASLESGNRGIRQQLVERYTTLLRALDHSDPLHAQAVSRLRTLREELRGLAVETAADTVVAEVSLAGDPVFAQIQSDEHIPQRDREQCVAHFATLPDKLKAAFLKRLQDVYTKPTQTVRITSLRAITFEMSRLSRVVQQKLETVDVTEVMDNVVVDYDGYNKDEVVFDAAHRHSPKKGSEIDFDVPISRDGKPVAYEVKSYSRKRYGHDAAARNQLLKYEAAIEQGKISGATVEVRGRIDPEFLNWVMGTAIDDKGFVPNVEIIYTTELPSGKEYRFVLKRSENGHGLRFQNEEKYSDEDLALIRGIQHSLIDKSVRGLLADSHIAPEASGQAREAFFSGKPIAEAAPGDEQALQAALVELFGLPEAAKGVTGVMRELIDNVADRAHVIAIWEKLLGPVPADVTAQPTGKIIERCRKQLRSREFTQHDVFAVCTAIVGYEVTENPQQAVKDLWDFTMADPARIASARVYDVYEQLRTVTIVDKLKASEERAKINRDNKASATSELANPIYVERLVREYQEFLAQNPAVAAMKRQYVISNEQIPAAVDRAMKIIEKIRAYELARQADPAESTRQAERQRLDYSGRPEGVALDIEHVAIDTLFSMNAEGLPRTDIEPTLKGATDAFFDDLGDGRVKVKWRTMDEFKVALAAQSDLKRTYDGLSKKYRDQLDIWVQSAAFVRSYEWPERFMRAEDLGAYLADKDRRYQEIHVYDPVSGKIEKHTNTNDEAIEKMENILTKENIERARAHIAGTSRADQYKRPIAHIEQVIKTLEQERDQAMADAKQAAQAVVAELGRRVGVLQAERKALVKQPEQAGRLAEVEAELAQLTEDRSAAFEQVRVISTEYLQRIQEQQRELERVYQQILPRAEWKTIARHITHRADDNIMKLIYAVTAEGDVIVQEEVLRAQVTGRAAHSELAQGRNTYGAGELAFEKRQGQWVLTEVNNGSGHYRPDADTTLHYTKNLLAKAGVDVSQVQTVDCILRGRPLREAAAF